MALMLAVAIEDGATPAIRALPAEINRRRRRALSRAGQVMRTEWRKQLAGPGSARRLGRRSGRLYNSIRSRLSGDAVVVGTDSPYARIHEFGGRTRAHIIRPRRGNVLSWIGPGGVRRFARSVNHPGSVIPPRPHLEPARDAARPKILRIVRVSVDDAIKAAKEHGRRHPLAFHVRSGTAQRAPTVHAPEVESAAGALADLLGQGGGE